MTTRRSPQDGRCPGSATSSCTIIEDNLIQANNNPNAPANDAVPPVGTGVQIAGGSYDTVTGNVIEDQGSWGYSPPTPPTLSSRRRVRTAEGGIENDPLPGICLFQARGNHVHGNVFSHDGFFGNLTNSDLATETLASYTPRNCFYRNIDRDGTVTSEPAHIESASVDGQPCGGPGTGNDLALAVQLICATAGPLPAAAHSGELPGADPHRDAAAAPATEHAEALRGRAEERVLPVTSVMRGEEARNTRQSAVSS